MPLGGTRAKEQAAPKLEKSCDGSILGDFLRFCLCIPERTHFSQANDLLFEAVQKEINICGTVFFPDPKPYRAYRFLLATADRSQDIGWLELLGCAGGTRGESKLLEGKDKCFPFNTLERNIQVARLPVFIRWAVE